MPLLTSWRVLPDFLGSDHHPISFSLVGSYPKHYGDHRLDWRSISWGDFRNHLASTLESVPPTPLRPNTPEELQQYYDALDTALQSTIEACVPLKRTCWASNPWWSPEIESLRRAFLQKRRRWLRTHSREDKVVANAHQRALRQAIATAKRDS